jgi:hypothetical protein
MACEKAEFSFENGTTFKDNQTSTFNASFAAATERRAAAAS